MSHFPFIIYDPVVKDKYNEGCRSNEIGQKTGWMDGNAASGFNYLSPGMSRILVRPVQFTSRS